MRLYRFALNKAHQLSDGPQNVCPRNRAVIVCRGPPCNPQLLNTPVTLAKIATTVQTVVVNTTNDGAHSTQKALVGRVRGAIKDAGINHSEVARRIGLDASKLSKSLAGTRKFRVEEISLIAELTDVTTDWLTTGRTSRPPRRQMVSDDRVAVAEDGAEAPALDEPWMSKGTRNRLKIIAAAWELYADRGIDKVRTEDVARASGLSTSAVNYHFRTKNQLLQAALRYSLEVIGRTRELNEPADPVSVLRRFARMHAGVDVRIRRVWSIWIQSWARASTDEDARTNLAGVYDEWLEMMTGVVLAGQRAGAIRTGDTALIVKSLSIFIDGLGVARSTEQMPLTDEEALVVLENYLSAHILTDDLPTHTQGRDAASSSPEPRQ
jgi:AcrR family transcriptional regulator